MVKVLTFGDPALPERYWAKVQPIPFPTWGITGCWLWVGSTTSKGYGSFNLGKDRRGAQRTGVAHKMAYEALHDRIKALKKQKKRLVLDHLCRVRCCVNPDHLDLVPEPVNVARGESPSALNARKTHCPRGHAYTAENTYELRIRSERRDTVKRYCRACRHGDLAFEDLSVMVGRRSA